ncbi:hypothetical protein GUJ93_ZPchr0010g7633 [Zizania palustris]|uniref:Aspartate transaminase n=1 Tax=Zizania palustris TaxID=103762 RepID=A0A8J6BFB4_ZIZPA|nr:hypothetical protein GUJ93_ZPchr0010g7633 [Zizania palustris]
MFEWKAEKCQKMSFCSATCPRPPLPPSRRALRPNRRASSRTLRPSRRALLPYLPLRPLPKPPLVRHPSGVAPPLVRHLLPSSARTSAVGCSNHHHLRRRLLPRSFLHHGVVVRLRRPRAGPEDPILVVTVAYNKDPSPVKVNLGVGAYRTREAAGVGCGQACRADTDQQPRSVQIPGSTCL